jgi:putative membrane protein
MAFLPFLLLLHLLGLAAFVGGAYGQQRFMRMSARPGTPAGLRDEYERLSAAILTKIEVPALFAQIATGVAVIVVQPYLLRQPWLHAKLTAVFLLLVLSHFEMFNARRLVKARAARGDAAADEIATRKRRHARMGAVETGLVVAVLLLATVLRGVM